MATLQPTIERRQYTAAPLRRVAWGAIFAGAAISTALMVLLGILGLAIGATVIEPDSADSPSARAFGIGAGVWWLVSGILALLAGGWATGRLAGLRRRWEAPLHGLVTWAVATTALVVLMGSAVGAVASGAFRVISTGAYLGDREAVRAEIERGMDSLQPRDPRPDERTTPPRERISRETADQAADALAVAAWWTCLFLFLTAIAATLGGVAGVQRSRGGAIPPERVVTTERAVRSD